MAPETETPKRGRFSGWIVRKPLTAFWTTLAVSLLLGAGSGAAGADNTAEVEAANDKIAATETKLRAESTRADDAESERDEAFADLKRATAKGEVPSFVGDSIDDAHASEIVEQFGWKIASTKEPSDEAVGTVLGQSIPAGDILKRGQTVTLAVATKRPKQWTTIFEESGAGSKRTDEFRIPAGKARISYTFTGDTNAILSLNTPGDEFGDTLLNEIGDYSDSTRIYDAEGTRYLEIQGGQWTVAVQVFK
jgi:hypothetical protein